MNYFVQKAGFVLRLKYYNSIVSRLNKLWFGFLGMKVGKGTLLTKMYVSWPHKVNIGNNCIIEQGVYFKFDGIWQAGHSIIIMNRVFIGSNCEFNIRQSISIGDDSLISSGCRFIDHDHGINLGALMRVQQGPEQKIVIGKDVWLGCNVVILKGVQISDGAIVAAGAVVTKSIMANEIWAGIPAKKIGERK